MATSVFAEHSQGVFTVYDVELTFDGDLMAGIPGNPQLIEGWLRGAGVKAEEERRQLLLRTLAEIGVEMAADASWEQIEEASKAAALQSQTCVWFRRVCGRMCGRGLS